MFRKEILIAIVLSFLLFACSGSSLNKLYDDIEGYNKGEVFAHAGDFKLSVNAVIKEYLAYVRSHFPRSMWKQKFKDKVAIKNYGEKMAIQLLLISSMKNNNKKNSADVELLLNAALRNALAEIYLRSKADLSVIVNSKAFKSMNEKMVNKLYKKNVAKYKSKKINMKTAKQSLRYAMISKKKDILQRYLYKKRLVIIQGLIKKMKYDIKYKLK